jgi:hypothetical protein
MNSQQSPTTNHGPRRAADQAFGTSRRSALLAGAVALTIGSGCTELREFVARPAAAPVPAALSSDDMIQSMPPAIGSEEDAIVRLVIGSVTCSGTLIAKDQVLTAHHCVARRSPTGAILAEDVAPSAIRVEIGGDYDVWGEVGVRAIVAPPCGHGTGLGDIAILVLDRALGIPTIPPRLDRNLQVGERILPVGFGRCALSQDGIRRRHRKGGNIEAIFPGRFRLKAAICPGDSGGPAFTALGQELVGVVSAAVMDGSEETLGESEFTRLDTWRGVFANAERIALGMSSAELPPLDCPEH